jgi:hypothetical protein
MAVRLGANNPAWRNQVIHRQLFPPTRRGCVHPPLTRVVRWKQVFLVVLRLNLPKKQNKIPKRHDHKVASSLHIGQIFDTVFSSMVQQCCKEKGEFGISVCS